MPCRISFSIITVKTPFLNGLLISLYYKSVKGVFYTKTNIFIGGDCLTDIPAKLTNMPVELTDIPIEVI